MVKLYELLNSYHIYIKESEINEVEKFKEENLSTKKVIYIEHRCRLPPSNRLI